MKARTFATLQQAAATMESVNEFVQYARRSSPYRPVVMPPCLEDLFTHESWKAARKRNEEQYGVIGLVMCWHKEMDEEGLMRALFSDC